MGATDLDPTVDLKLLERLEARALVEECISVLRHDVRNRLGAIRNANFYLKSKTKQTELWTSDRRIESFFGLVDEEIKRADEVVSEPAFMDSLYSFKTERVQVSDVVGDATTSFDVVRSDVEPALLDIDRLELVVGLRCLIRNAVEASMSGSSVRVLGRLEGERYVLTVVDSAGGFLDIEQAMVPFYTTKSGHLGLGINIAERVARRYNGKLVVESQDTSTSVSLIIEPTKGEGS